MRAVQELRPGLVTVPAFLDLSEPDLTAAVAALQGDLGVSEAVVLPLLFTEAFHARVDAPTAVREAQEATGVTLRLGGILGMGDEVLQALQDSAGRAHIAVHEAILLLAVGSSRDEANLAVHDLAERWSARRPGPVWAGFATTGEPQASELLTAGPVQWPQVRRRPTVPRARSVAGRDRIAGPGVGRRGGAAPGHVPGRAHPAALLRGAGGGQAADRVERSYAFVTIWQLSRVGLAPRDLLRHTRRRGNKAGGLQ